MNRRNIEVIKMRKADSSTKWDRILHKKEYSQEKPDEVVLDFISFLKKRKRKLRVLDLGCGAGRHQVYLAKLGIEAYGADISWTGLKLTKDRLEKEALSVYLVKCDMKLLPYVDSCFDAVVCVHVIYHQELMGMQETVSEIRRILKDEGAVLVNFLSKRTYSYGKGAETEENTFNEQEGPERTVLHHFTDRREIKHLFRNFEIVSLQLAEREIDGKLRSRWILIASRKPSTPG